MKFYHCDQRGLALISTDNTVAWRAEYDEWGNRLSEESPAHHHSDGDEPYPDAVPAGQICPATAHRNENMQLPQWD